MYWSHSYEEQRSLGSKGDCDALALYAHRKRLKVRGGERGKREILDNGNSVIYRDIHTTNIVMV